MQIGKRGKILNTTVKLAATLLAVSALHLKADAQCVKPADTEWKKVTLVDQNSPVKLNKPVSMSVLPDGRVFLGEMWTGKIMLFTPGTGVTEAGMVPGSVGAVGGLYRDGAGNGSEGVENGLLGIAADPDFAHNNWVYLFYSRKTKDSSYIAGDGGINPHEHVLARMTFANGKLGNPKDILSFARLTKRHAAGGISFNSATGELFIPTGDDVYPSDLKTHWGGRNEAQAYLNDLRSAANTNDLRGKVLRIKPIPFPDNQTPAMGVGTTYSIPVGNLFPVGKDSTRPEIYTMGHRNPYKIKIDPVSGVGLIGEVGPDAGGPDPARGPTGSDEFNLVTGSGNYGWPFAIADNQPYIAYDGEAYTKGTIFDLSNLKNKSKFNTGITNLPPAIGAFGYYNARNSQTGANTAFGNGAETAISGPYYRFDAAKPDAKMPAFFNGKFIVGDWSRNTVWSLELNSNKTLKKVEKLWDVPSIIDLAIGPDGDLYVLQYASTGGYGAPNNSGVLFKMQYNKPQYAANLCSQYVLTAADGTGLAAAQGPARASHPRLLVNLASGLSFQAPAGSAKGLLYSLKGDRIWEGRVQSGLLTLPRSLGANLGFLQFQ